MKILFLTDNFPPEVNAPASRTYDHCKEWVKEGQEVTVITCAPNFPQGRVYSGYKNKLYQMELMDGIRVIRVWSYMVPNKGFLKRTLDYISFSISSFVAGLFVKTDLIIATSPQFFTALSGRALHCWKRKPWVMEVRDLWPESIKTVGAAKSDWLIKYFEWQEMRCYRSASKIIVVTDSFKDILSDRGVASDKISIIKNGVDRLLFHPLHKDINMLNINNLSNRGGQTVVGYIGTFGLAHQLNFILDCAKKLVHENYQFLLIGDGAERERLVARVRDEGIMNVMILPPVPKQEVPQYISVLDLSLINLKKSSLFTTVIPSKIFENAAMGIPMIVGVEGETKRLIEGYGAGLCFEPENEADFSDKLHLLSCDKRVYDSCREGCLKLAEDYDRTRLARKMLEVLLE